MNSKEFEEFVKPALSYTSTKSNEAVKLRTGSSRLDETKPITLTKFFYENCEKYAKRPAISYEQFYEHDSQTNWITLTYTEYAAKVEQVALMLLKLGLKPYEGVGILAYNCPEWFYTNMAAINAGGIPFGIYETSSTDAIHHMLETAEATICIVDDAIQMDKIRVIHSRLPKLRAIVQLNGPFANFVGVEQGYYKWQDLIILNYERKLKTELKQRESELYANQCAALVFTSGTTGLPKAVLLSHDNIVFSTKLIFSEIYKEQCENLDVISYLPLSHVGGQTMDIYGSIYLGAHVHFADRNSLKGTLLRTLLKVRPTIFFGVPRVLEKFFEHIKAKEQQISVKSSAQVLVKQLLGLERCKWFYVGGAPISQELKQFYYKLNFQLFDVYGLSEIVGGPIQNFNNKKFNTVGKPLEGVEVKTQNHPYLTDQEEVCLRGRNVFMGYLNQPEETAKTIDAQGWLHSGDLGYIDEDGDLIITGRLKELIITSGGENIPFLLIEQTIKKELPIISNLLVVGDQRKYLTVLLTLKTDMDAVTGTNSDKLSQETIKWLNSLDLYYKTLSEILYSACEDNNNKRFTNNKINPKILNAIEAGIKRANAKALSNAQRIQNFRLLPHDFSVKTGELGAVLKIRRSFILQKYADLIESMYDKPTTSS